MDFVTLATAAHETSRTILRFLKEDSSEDDDFAHLENIGGRSSSPEVIAGSASNYDTTTGGQYTSSYSSTTPPMENRPLLSPTAEAALLELSTNFLLYCAMVLITTMVAKIYFPSCLEPREAPTPRLSKNYMDVIRESYKSDLSDEEEEDEGVEDEEEMGGLLPSNSEEGKSSNKEESAVNSGSSS